MHPPKPAARAAALVLALLVLSTSATAQKDPMKFGKIENAMVGVTAFQADSNASAVVLGDFGSVEYSSSGESLFERHTRILILNEAGYEHGTVELIHSNERRITNLKGHTYVLNEDGKVVRHKLDKKAIFKDELDGDFERVRFTMPALAPGAVIEYTYKEKSEYPFFTHTWRFQRGEPTLWSEFRIQIPNFLEYGTLYRGRENFAIRDENRFNRGGIRGTSFRWAIEDVPALREEPYMTTPLDYVAQIRLQLAAVNFRGVREDVLGSWRSVAEALIDNPYIGDQIDKKKDVQSAVDEVLAGLPDTATPLQKMVAMYDWVRSSITWSETYGRDPDKSVREVLEQRTGNAASINLTLLAMLRTAGLDVDPMLISTRSNGQASEQYPLVNQFNYFLAHVAIGQKSYVLDATDPMRPHTMLPTYALSYRGWIVDKDNPRWITYGVGKMAEHTSVVNAAVDDLGAVKVDFSSTHKGYSALAMRHAFDGETVDDMIWDTVLEGVEGAELDSASVAHLSDTSEDLTVKAAYHLPDGAMAAGDFIYLDVQQTDRYLENPLKLEDRTFPVDFAYPLKETYVFNLALPAGYAVQEHPKSTKIMTPSQSAVYVRRVQAVGGQLVVHSTLFFKRPVYQSSEYTHLRSFFDQVVAAQAEQIVLKVAPAAGSEDAGSAGVGGDR